jgi:hypothetical protein
MFNRTSWRVVAEVCVLAMAALAAMPAAAQTAEVKEKPPMYSYVAFWSLPRAQWGEMEKGNATNQKILDNAMASGTLVGHGQDANLVHQQDGETHDSWWSAMSMAGVLNILDEFHKASTTPDPVLASATKHWDNIFVSRYYNWHPGTWKGAYTYGAVYKLKSDAPDDAVEKLSRHLVVPLMEKLLAAGTIVEYEVDTEAVHSDAPGLFFIFYLTPNAEGLDKVNMALRETLKSNPLGGSAFGSVVDYSAHRDYLARTNATYK